MLHEVLSARTELDGNDLDGLSWNSTYPFEPTPLFIDTVFQYRAFQYAVGAAITLWVYDLFLTFESELELFWKQRDRVPINVLYLMASLLVF